MVFLHSNWAVTKTHDKQTLGCKCDVLERLEKALSSFWLAQAHGESLGNLLPSFCVCGKKRRRVHGTIPWLNSKSKKLIFHLVMHKDTCSKGRAGKMGQIGQHQTHCWSHVFTLWMWLGSLLTTGVLSSVRVCNLERLLVVVNVLWVYPAPSSS